MKGKEFVKETALASPTLVKSEGFKDGELFVECEMFDRCRIEIYCEKDEEGHFIPDGNGGFVEKRIKGEKDTMSCKLCPLKGKFKRETKEMSIFKGLDPAKGETTEVNGRAIEEHFRESERLR